MSLSVSWWLRGIFYFLYYKDSRQYAPLSERYMSLFTFKIYSSSQPNHSECFKFNIHKLKLGLFSNTDINTVARGMTLYFCPEWVCCFDRTSSASTPTALKSPILVCLHQPQTCPFSQHTGPNRQHYWLPLQNLILNQTSLAPRPFEGNNFFMTDLSNLEKLMLKSNLTLVGAILKRKLTINDFSPNNEIGE